MNTGKMSYGIDLGTTNSSICHIEQGTPTLLRTDALREVMPSCVSFTKRQTAKVGEGAFNDLKQDKRRATRSWRAAASNTYTEFKRAMGTDTVFHSSHMQRDYTPVELSAQVLSALKAFASEPVRDAVVTVPAKFTVNQKTATLEAAHQAGIEHCELLQEPLAAAMAYGLTGERTDGRWLVFDFGGGTFDAALLQVEEGIIQVSDTEGDNFLGGKNLDYALVDRLILPHVGQNHAIEQLLTDPEKKAVLRDALKTYAEEAKIQLSMHDHYDLLSDLGDLGCDDDGNDIELDMTITRQQADSAMRPVVMKAVDICQSVLERNNLTGSQIDRIILVGGPTRLPLFKQLLTQVIGATVDTSIDPMTAVAVGAAIYASTLDVASTPADTDAPRQSVRLDVGYEPSTVEVEDWVSLRLAEPAPPGTFSVTLARADGAWNSGRVELNSGGRVVTVALATGRPNVFRITLFGPDGNPTPCTPDQITILQGTLLSSAVLPYNIGISVWDDSRQSGVFTPLTGLTKNKPLPAVGIVRGRRTTTMLRPGVESDVVKIPVYQADDYYPLTRSYLYEWVADVTVTGGDVDCVVPQNTLADITLRVDASEQMTMEVYFPNLDTTIAKPLNTSKLQSVDEADRLTVEYIASAYRSLSRLNGEGCDVSRFSAALAGVEQERESNTESKAVLQHLKAVLREIERLDGMSEQDRAARLLDAAVTKMTTAQALHGNDSTALRVSALKAQAMQAKALGDPRTCMALIDVIESHISHIKRMEIYKANIEFYLWNFDTLEWKDKERARALLDKAVQMVDNNASADQLTLYANELYSLRVRDTKSDNNSDASGDGDNANGDRRTHFDPRDGMLT